MASNNTTIFTLLELFVHTDTHIIAWLEQKQTKTLDKMAKMCYNARNDFIIIIKHLCE